MSLFADDVILQPGDVALLLRPDGSFQLAAGGGVQTAVDMAADMRRIDQHMAIMVGLYLLAQDDEKYMALAILGQGRDAQQLIRDNLPAGS